MGGSLEERSQRMCQCPVGHDKVKDWVTRNDERAQRLGCLWTNVGDRYGGRADTEEEQQEPEPEWAAGIC